jgi:phospholipid transport system substrate-binding protein
MKIKTILALFVMLASLLMPSAWARSAPEKLIQDTTQDVLDTIKAHHQEFLDEPGKLYDMVDEKVLPHFDFERMTNLALGRYKRKVKGEKKKQLVEAFRNLLVRTYGKALLEYNDQEVEYLPMRGKVAKGEVTIRTEIQQQGGFPIPINYDLYLKDGQWKVYDLSIDNVSMVTNYRTTFAREIKSKGVDSLIKTLQNRNKEER